MDGGLRGRVQTTVEWGAYKLTQVFLPEPHPPCRMHANNHLAHTYHPLPHSPIPPPHTPFWSRANDEQLLKKLRWWGLRGTGTGNLWGCVLFATIWRKLKCMRVR